MTRNILSAKLHRLTVTHADLDYEGSLTLPPNLMKAADILEYEAISVWNITNGSRFETYAITGSNEKDVCVNGAAAHLTKPNDLIIVASFVQLTEDEIKTHQPKMIFLDSENKIKLLDNKEVPGPNLRKIAG